MSGTIDKILLFPYYLTLSIRHFLYDRGIKKAAAYSGVNIIGIGNITVGGTGKTPHAEMLVRLLKDRHRIAVLSRGYKRKSKGFRIAGADDTFRTVGDEPLQIKRKFPGIIVAVCESRREGIGKLLALPVGERPDIIILDDSFQHRKVLPRHSIVLMKYDKPVFKDHLLPLGTLRDLPDQIKRADNVIITKSPRFDQTDDGITDEKSALEKVEAESLRWRRELGLKAGQHLYFSVIDYGFPLPVFPGEGDNRYIYSENAVFFTGIADDREFRNNLLGRYHVLDWLKFPDHKKFSSADLRHIARWARKYPTAAVFTTEKDSMRLSGCARIAGDLKKRLFYIPIKVSVIPSLKQQEFIDNLLA